MTRSLFISSFVAKIPECRTNMVPFINIKFFINSNFTEEKFRYNSCLLFANMEHGRICLKMLLFENKLDFYRTWVCTYSLLCPYVVLGRPKQEQRSEFREWVSVKSFLICYNKLFWFQICNVVLKMFRYILNYFRLKAALSSKFR